MADLRVGRGSLRLTGRFPLDWGGTSGIISGTFPESGDFAGRISAMSKGIQVDHQRIRAWGHTDKLLCGILP